MAVSTLVGLLMCVWLSSATYQNWEWSVCGSDPSISLQRLTVSPMPMVLPGPVHLSVQGSMSRSLPSDIEIRLSIKRSTFLFDLPIPCVYNIGSCTYQSSCSAAPGHSLLDRMISENWAGMMADVGRQIRNLIHALPQINTTACPVPAASVNLQDFTFNMPGVPSILSVFAAGDYSAQMKAVDKSNGRTFLCLKTHMSLKQKEKPCIGFFCG